MLQDTEEQVDTGSVINDETTDTGEDNWTPDKTSTNKSNFKKLSDSLKTERAEKARISQEKAELEEELNAWRSENPDLVKSTLSKKSDGIDKWDLALFLVQNPDAKNHLDEVKEYLAEMKNPDLEKAWKYVKPTISQESVSKDDFSIKWQPKATGKLENLTMDEAYAPWALSKEQRAKWREIHNKE
jgi:hypothetical protein